MIKKLLLLLVLVCLISLPLSTKAAVFLADDNEVVTQDLIDDDVFAVGNLIRLIQEVRGDVIAAGQTVEITKAVSEDIIAAGSMLYITGPVADDIIVAGNDISITSPSADDVLAAGNTIEISRETTVNGDAYLAGNIITLNGHYTGDVRIAGERVTIAADTVIDGNLTTTGGNQPTIHETARINGTTTHQAKEAEQTNRRSQILSLVRGILASFIGALVLLYALPGLTTFALQASRVAPLKNIAVGLLWLLLCIPVTILLIATLIGLPLAAGVGLFTGLLLVIAYLFSNLIAADIIARQFFKGTTQLTWQHVLLAVIVLKAISFVPLIGPLVLAALLLWSLGALLVTLWQLLRGTPATNAPVGTTA